MENRNIDTMHICMDELDFISRLMACTDIYQAVREERPYHPGRSHADTIPILRSMAEQGFIDKKIVEDFDKVMAKYSNKDVPPPEPTLQVPISKFIL